MKNVSAWLVQKLLSKEGQHPSTIREYEPGQCIFRVGDPGDYLAVVLSGGVAIRKNGIVISMIEHGGMFGEMGIIDGKLSTVNNLDGIYCAFDQER